MRSECFPLKKMLDKRKVLCYHTAMQKKNENDWLRANRINAKTLLGNAVERLAKNADYIMDSMETFKDYIETHYEFPKEFKGLGITDRNFNEVHIAAESRLCDISRAYLDLDSNGKVAFGYSLGKGYESPYLTFNMDSIPTKRDIAKAVSALEDANHDAAILAEHWLNKVCKVLDNIERARAVLAHRAEISKSFAEFA